MSSFRFDTVTVLGAGTMGRGIAQVAAATGSAVHLLDVDADAAAAAKQAIAASLERAVAKGKVEAALPETMVNQITLGSSVTVSFPPLGDAEVTGTVKKVHVEAGQNVDAGDPLFEIG